MKIIITGGAGFIGSNAAARYLNRGAEVIVFDNLSRTGSRDNLAWLKKLGGNLTFIRGNIERPSDAGKLAGFIPSADAILHLAAQVAVTTSLEEPVHDFRVNALGTLHILEMMRSAGSKAKLIYASTNKVYGGLEAVGIEERETRYAYKNNVRGIDEHQLLDFHSPYGCSKGSADQYVRDYHRIFGLDTVVMRQSCIYGPRQIGQEEQGWTAWFMIAAIRNLAVTIYGDGKQVRDVLYIDDLLDAYDKAILAGKKTAGRIYNIGGGPEQAISVWNEFAPLLTGLSGRKLTTTCKPWRPGDQKVYISDVGKALAEFGWQPETSVRDGMTKLYSWLHSHIAEQSL